MKNNKLEPVHLKDKEGLVNVTSGSSSRLSGGRARQGEL